MTGVVQPILWPPMGPAPAAVSRRLSAAWTAYASASSAGRQSSGSGSRGRARRCAQPDQRRRRCSIAAGLHPAKATGPQVGRHFACSGDVRVRRRRPRVPSSNSSARTWPANAPPAAPMLSPAATATGRGRTGFGAWHPALPGAPSRGPCSRGRRDRPRGRRSSRCPSLQSSWRSVAGQKRRGPRSQCMLRGPVGIRFGRRASSRPGEQSAAAGPFELSSPAAAGVAFDYQPQFHLNLRTAMATVGSRRRPPTRRPRRPLEIACPSPIQTAPRSRARPGARRTAVRARPLACRLGPGRRRPAGPPARRAPAG